MAKQRRMTTKEEEKNVRFLMIEMTATSIHDHNNCVVQYEKSFFQPNIFHLNLTAFKLCKRAIFESARVVKRKLHSFLLSSTIWTTRGAVKCKRKSEEKKKRFTDVSCAPTLARFRYFRNEFMRISSIANDNGKSRMKKASLKSTEHSSAWNKITDAQHRKLFALRM